MGNTQSRKALIIDDDQTICALFADKLTRIGLSAGTAQSIKEAMQKLRSQSFDLILLDLYIDDDFSLDFLGDIICENPSSKVVILTGKGTIDIAVSAMSKGASGFLLKTDAPEENMEKIEDVLREDRPSLSEESSLQKLGILGNSRHMKLLSEKIQRLQHVDSTVLLNGESGTGKELVAKAIHKTSDRSSGPFIAINCAAITETILESELFGYKKGAFTDANRDRKGYFETCSNGTLLLDEIGEMSPGLQSKLLRVLQEKEVTPLGSCSPVSINTRIIAATNRDLMLSMKEKRFREDLFYRLAVFQIELPPLRERREDIPDLVNHFIEKYNEKFNKNIVPPSRSMMARIKAYHWPGNVRELQNAVERAVVLAPANRAVFDDFLPHNVLANETSEESTSPRISELSLNFQKAKDSFEQYYITNLLEQTCGNVAEAARVSGQYRPNVYRLINKFKLDPHYFKSQTN